MQRASKNVRTAIRGSFLASVALRVRAAHWDMSAPMAHRCHAGKETSQMAKEDVDLVNPDSSAQVHQIESGAPRASIKTDWGRQDASCAALESIKTRREAHHARAASQENSALEAVREESVVEALLCSVLQMQPP